MTSWHKRAIPHDRSGLHRRLEDIWLWITPSGKTSVVRGARLAQGSTGQWALDTSGLLETCHMLVMFVNCSSFTSHDQSCHLRTDMDSTAKWLSKMLGCVWLSSPSKASFCLFLNCFRPRIWQEYWCTLVLLLWFSVQLSWLESWTELMSSISRRMSPWFLWSSWKAASTWARPSMDPPWPSRTWPCASWDKCFSIFCTGGTSTPLLLLVKVVKCDLRYYSAISLIGPNGPWFYLRQRKNTYSFDLKKN